MIKLFFALVALTTAAGAVAATDPNSTAAPVHFTTRDLFVARVDMFPLFLLCDDAGIGVSVVTILPRP
jgi:hypothetical protein